MYFTHKRPFSTPGRALVALLASLPCLLFLPAAAEAASITFTVKNDQGISQPATVLKNGTATSNVVGGTDNGTVTINNLNPGDQLRFARNPFASSSCIAPEGTGVLYTVPGAPPLNASVVLPSVQAPSYVPNEPGLSNVERGFLGLINDQRAQSGSPALRASVLLSSIEDRYANYLTSTGKGGSCALSDLTIRAVDAGWEGSTLAEGTIPAASAREAFAQMTSDYAMFNSRYDAVGIGHVGNLWVIMVGQSSDAPSGDLTADIGDSSLADGPGGPGPLQNPRIHLGRSTHRAHAVRFSFDSASGVPLGQSTLTLTRKGSTRHITLRGHNGNFSSRATLPYGRWHLEVDFAGDETWKPQTLCRTLILNRPKHSQRGDWVKIRTDSC